MLYAIIAEDVPGSLDKRLAARPAHVERLKALLAEGRLVLAGPHPLIDAEDPGPAGFSGSLIARNNVTVAALAFGLGLTAGIGTAFLLVGNGLLLGAVIAHLAQHGMAAGLLGFVAAHGPAELSALLLAGQAGFVLASALVDPGE